MGWHYQARKREERGEVWYELVEAFPDPFGWTENPVHVIGETKEDLAKWLRIAADDVEKYDAIEE